MSQSISLTVQMNSPCEENWNSMESAEQGRFCNKCQKTVTDFTDFTDQQIFQYFLKNPFPVCGRILIDQRDREFENSTAKINRHLSPVAASLLTLATFTADATPPAPIKENMQQTQLPDNKEATPVPADSVIISGTVKDRNGAPIENAEIIFEQFKLSSDKNGHFRFSIPSALNKPAVIQFSYGKLDREVRSYHPLMGSATFEVTLYEPYYPQPHYMGIAIPAFQLPNPFSTLAFQSSNQLDTETKAFLSDLAQFIKDEMRRRYIVRSYYKSSKQKAVKLSNLIQKYLVDKEGISPERIRLADPQLRKNSNSQVVIEFAQDSAYE
jgi:hypothetical protein